MGITNRLVAALMTLAAASSAQAVHLDAGGRGQVLIYPYYTVNKNQQTLLSVTNTTAVAQAGKVRFYEGYNGREVLSFNLFLAPYDSWTGTIFALRDAGIPSDGAALLSNDTSCTSPFFSEAGTSINGSPYVAFRDQLYLMPNDGGPFTINRTREGFVEIITMANLADPLASYVSHGGDGSPPTGCSLVRNLVGSEAGLSAPTGGLVGTVSVINVGQGTIVSARAEALGRFTARLIFSSAGAGIPNLASVNDGVGPVLGLQATARLIDENGVDQTLTYPGADSRSRRVDAVSAVLMADHVYNEFQTDAGLGASSDWVVTMPTKPYYTDPLFTGTSMAVPPFTGVYSGPDEGASAYFTRTIYNRESAVQRDAPCPAPCSPAPPTRSFAYVTTIVPIGRNVVSESGVLGSRLVTGVNPLIDPPGVGFGAGGVDLFLDAIEQRHALLPSAEGKVLRGLPLVGFWASNIVNSNVSAGVLANYAAAVRHSTSVTCVKASDGTPCD